MKTKSIQRNRPGPQLLTFMLNNTCISRCIYCCVDTKTKVDSGLATGRILELIEEACALPVRAIRLTGGELFLHPDWFVILKKTVDCNLSPEHISTKYPLTEEIIEDIQKSGFDNSLQISLDACSSDLLMKTLSVRNDYLIQVMRGIKLLDNSGLKYRIRSVLTTYNAKIEVLEKLFLFITLLKNITDWRITPAVNSGRPDCARFREIKPSENEIESVYERMERIILPNSKIPVLLNRPAIRREYRDRMFILPDGQVTLCEQRYWSPRFIIGDVSKTGISEVWNARLMINDRELF